MSRDAFAGLAREIEEREDQLDTARRERQTTVRSTREMKLAEELAKCIGALRGVADGMTKVGQAPETCKQLRGIADDAMRALETVAA